MRAVLLERVREEVVAAARRLEEAGLLRGTAGNLSARDGRLVAVTPSGVGYRELEAAQVGVLDLDGRPVDGELLPSSETPLHLAVYRARADAGAVVHTHSMFATTLAVLGEELPAVHYHLALAGTRVRVAPYATYGSQELAARCVATLGGDRAVLLANHGVVALGADLRRAQAVAEAVEFTAELYWRARAIGTPRVLPAEEIARVAAAFASYGQPPAGHHPPAGR